MKTETRVLCEHSSNGRQLLDILEKGESIFLTMVLKQYITFSLNHPRASLSRSTSYAIPSSHTLNLFLFFVLKCAFLSVQDLRLFFKTNKPQQNTTTRTHTHTPPSNQVKIPGDSSITNIDTRGEKSKLKCIRIRTCTKKKKKLKYNLKPFKFRKASQVLFSCQEIAIIRGLWVTSRGGREARNRSSNRSFTREGPGRRHPHRRCSREGWTIPGEQVRADRSGGQPGPSHQDPKTRLRSQRQQEERPGENTEPEEASASRHTHSTLHRCSDTRG